MSERIPATPSAAGPQTPPAPPGPPIPRHRKGPTTGDYLCLALLGLIFGSTYMFIGFGVQTIPPFTLAAARVLIGLAALTIIALSLGHKVPRDWRIWRAFLIIGLVGFAAPFAMMNVAQQHIDSSLAAILITSGPLFTLVLANTFTDDKANWRKFAGVVIGFAGVLMLLGPAALAGAGGSLYGQLLYVGVAFLFATTQVLIRALGLGTLPPLVRAACSTFTTALFLVPAAFILESPLSVQPSTPSLLGMLALGLLSSGAGQILIFRLNANVGPNFVSANNYMGPPVGLLLGALMLGEQITWLRITAMLVIFVGIAFATSRKANVR